MRVGHRQHPYSTPFAFSEGGFYLFTLLSIIKILLGGVMNESGFTLIELLVIITILAILVVIAYPHFIELRYAWEAKRVEATFINALKVARAESYIHKKDVVLCTLNEAGACQRGGTDRLVVFYDNNGDAVLDANDKLVWQSDWGVKHGDLLLNVSLRRDYIKFMGASARPLGHIGHLRYCSVSDNRRLSFKVIINMAGNVRVERGDLVGVGC